MREWGWLILIVAAVAGLVVAALVRHVELMQQCIDDGRKEYECEALINGGRR